MQVITGEMKPFNTMEADLLLAVSIAPADASRALIGAVDSLQPFSRIRVLDLGLTEISGPFEVERFDIDLADARALYEKGRAYGKTYQAEGDYLVLGSSSSDTLQKAAATLSALHFTLPDAWESASNPGGNLSIYEKLSQTADSTLVFLAGFVLEASRRFEIVLGGGAEMVAVVLVADRLATRLAIPHDPRHIWLWMTSYTYETSKEALETLLDQLNFSPKLRTAVLPFENPEWSVLKALIDVNRCEPAGAGAVLGYGLSRGVAADVIGERAT
jgi:NaMN:DMB phosphoribosyltransferase